MEAEGSEGLAELLLMSLINIQNLTGTLASTLAPNDKGHKGS